MQYWTKNKPTNTGYYWIKFNEDYTAVVYISVNQGNIYVTIEDEVLDITHNSLKNVLWGENKIQEPVGLKI
jgi:hypothetical protein